MHHVAARFPGQRLTWIMFWGGGLLLGWTPVAAAFVPQGPGFRIGDIVRVTAEGQVLEAPIFDLDDGVGYIELTNKGTMVLLAIPLPQLELVRRGPSPPKIPVAEARLSKPTASSAPPVRRWTDQSGKFSVEGRLARVADGVVYLIAADGRQLKIPMEKLSAADQKLAQAPPKSSGNSPFVPLGLDPVQPPPFEASPLAPETTAPAPTSPSDNLRKAMGNSPADIAAPVPLVKLPPSRDVPGGGKERQPGKGEVEFQPDAQGPQPPLPRRIRLANLYPFQPFGVFNRTRTHLAVSSNNMDYTQIQFYALDQPDSYAAINISKGDSIALRDPVSVAAISPNGTRLLTFTYNRIDLWRCSSVLLEPIGAWNAKLSWADFVDDNRLLFVSDGSTYCVDCEPFKIIWSYPRAGLSFPGLSANGRYAAIISQKRIKVVDVQQGQEYADLEPGFSGDWSSVLTCADFSPNGENVAVNCQGSVEVWDLATRERVRQFSVPSTPDSSVQWLGDDLLLCGVRYIVDVQRGQVVWQLGPCGLTHPHALGFDHLWFWSGQDYVWRLDLPPAELSRNLALASGGPASELELTPGSGVAIDLDLNFPEKSLATIQAAVRAQIEKNRWTESAQPEYIIRAYVRQMEPETREFHRRLHPFVTEPVAKITFRPTTSVVEIIDRAAGDRVIWHKEQLNHPDRSVPVLQPNSTPQQAVDRTCQPNLNFFTDVMLPTSFSPAAAVQASVGTTTVGAFGPDDSQGPGP